MGEIVHGIFQVGVLDEIGIVLVCFLSIYCLLIKRNVKLYNYHFVLFAFLLFVVYILFYFTTLVSFSYELYKLSIFLVFLPIIKEYQNEERYKVLAKKGLNLLVFFLKLNIFIILLQFIFGRDVLKYLLYSDLRLYGSEGAGRLTGFMSIGTLGATSLLVVLINDLFNKKNKSYLKILVLGVISVLLSTSKISYLILICWVLIKYWDLLYKYFVKILVCLSFIVFSAFYLAKEAIYSKIHQYSFLIRNIDDPSIINLATVEKRAMFIAKSISIFKENLFGLGFGTFGDTSSKFNPNNFKMAKEYWEEESVYMSDSAFFHYLAEQGIVYVLMLFLIFYPYFKLKKGHRKYFLMFYLFYILQSLVTMGFSVGTWPIIFAFIYGIFYYSNFNKSHVEQV